MCKHLSIIVVCLTEEQKNERYYSNHEHIPSLHVGMSFPHPITKTKLTLILILKNYTKSPYKYQLRPMQCICLIRNTH